MIVVATLIRFGVFLLIRMQRAHFPKVLFGYVPDTVQ